MYDICVVGAGLIGSAAARHLVENYPSLKVLLIGPGEPEVSKQGCYEVLCCLNLGLIPQRFHYC